MSTSSLLVLPVVAVMLLQLVATSVVVKGGGKHGGVGGQPGGAGDAKLVDHASGVQGLFLARLGRTMAGARWLAVCLTTA